MKMPLFRAALVTSALAVVLLPAGSATAAGTIIDDAVGDTWKANYDDATETESFEPGGSQVNVDLDKTVVKHKRGAVVVKAKYAELKRNDKILFLGLKLRTNEGVKRDAGVHTLGRAKGEAYLADPRSMDDVRCRGLAHEIDYAANTVTLTVPRGCLSKPSWVQVSVGAFGIEDNETGDVYVDNGHNATSNEPKTWSEKVRRG